MSLDAWVKIETFGFPIAMAAYMTTQIMMLQSYLIEEDDES